MIECLAAYDDDEKMRVLGYGIADVENATGSDDNRVILVAEDRLEMDRFAVYEVPIPELMRQTAGRRDIKVALAFDPPVRHTRLDYAGTSMSFDLVRGAPDEDVFRSFRRWSKRTNGESAH